jgi:hypothetical protein
MRPFTYFLGVVVLLCGWCHAGPVGISDDNKSVQNSDIIVVGTVTQNISTDQFATSRIKITNPHAIKGAPPTELECDGHATVTAGKTYIFLLKDPAKLPIVLDFVNDIIPITIPEHVENMFSLPANNLIESLIDYSLIHGDADEVNFLLLRVQRGVDTVPSNVRKLLKSGKEQLSVEAFYTLAVRKQAISSDDLLLVLKEAKSAQARHKVITALPLLPKSSAAPLSDLLLLKSELSEDELPFFAEALGNWDDPASIPILQSLLQVDDVDVQYSAIMALHSLLRKTGIDWAPSKALFVEKRPMYLQRWADYVRTYLAK